MNRRRFLALISAAGLVPLLARAQPSAPVKAPRILLRSSWNTDNIGDIAHTPGMLALLEKHLPDAEITLAPLNVGHGVEEMLLRRFPRLRIAKGREATLAALDSCDFFLHGSGPGLLAGDYARMAGERGIPYGIGGVTLNDGEIKSKLGLLDKARFVFTRDTESLESLRAAGCSSPVVEFGPDATFAFDLRDDETAAKTLAEHRLEPGKFLVAVPRLRWTPVWKPHQAAEPWAVRKIKVNEEFAEVDHAKVRAAIVAWVRRTRQRVLLAPEMDHVPPLLRPLLYDGLPDDVKPHVASLDRYWITDEAFSVYSQAAAMVTIEQHSPILAIAAGVPAVLLRQNLPGIHRKAQMWKDLGMAGWLLDIDSCIGEQVARVVLDIAADPAAARTRAAKARDQAHDRMAAMMARVRGALA